MNGHMASEVAQTSNSAKNGSIVVVITWHNEFELPPCCLRIFVPRERRPGSWGPCRLADARLSEGHSWTWDSQNGELHV